MTQQKDKNLKTVHIYGYLSKRAFSKIHNKKDIKIVFLRKEKSLVVSLENINVIDLSFLNSDGCWKGWELLESDFKNLTKVPQIHEMDYLPSLKKKLYHSFYKERGIIEVYRTYLLEMGFIPKIRTKNLNYAILFSMLLQLLSILFLFNRNKNIPEDSQGKFVIPFIGKNQYYLWQDVIKELGIENVLFLVDEKMEHLQKEFNDVHKKNGRIIFLAVNYESHYKSMMFKEKIQFLKFILFMSKLKNISSSLILSYSYIKLVKKASNLIPFFKQLKPSVILTNAYEVNHSVNLFCQIIRQSNGRTVNTMNGIKNIDPKNNETNFDAWCIWNNNQKELLSTYNRIPRSQLFITGHLNADQISKHEYSGGIDNVLKSFSGDKKIVSIFSQPSNYSGEYRKKFLISINRFFNVHQNITGLLKPHPREDISDYDKYFKDKGDNLIILEKEMTSKNFLYDLIYKSDLTVVMYSTVAIEALFFGKPVISLDYTGIENMLPLVDGKVVFKCTDYYAFEQKVLLLLASNFNIDNNYIVENLSFVDGRNHKRVAQVIKKIAAN